MSVLQLLKKYNGLTFNNLNIYWCALQQFKIFKKQVTESHTKLQTKQNYSDNKTEVIVIYLYLIIYN